MQGIEEHLKQKYNWPKIQHYGVYNPVSKTKKLIAKTKTLLNKSNLRDNFNWSQCLNLLCIPNSNFLKSFGKM